MNTSNKLIKNEFLTTFLFAFGYGLIFYLLQIFIYRIQFTPFSPDATTLAHWDANIYLDIAEHGYYFNDTGGDTQMFVLFPWIWRLLHVDAVGMSIANYTIFCLGFSFLCTIYRISFSEKLLWLTTPSLYFVMVPYSEATFFIVTALVFYGINRNNRGLTAAALFMLCLCRATASFMLPALFVMELITSEKKDRRKALGSYFIYQALPILSGTFAFILIQYLYTGQWMVYYKQQVKQMGHEFSVPVLPFSDYYGGVKMLWLNALAMCVCTVALIILINIIYKWLSKGKTQYDKLWILTIAYMPIVMFTMVFINPKWGSLTTNLLGMHRYVFCSPFIFVFIYHLVNKISGYKAKHFIYLFVIANLVLLTFASYVHIQQFLFYNFCTLIMTGYMVYATNKTGWAGMALCALNLFFQVSFFQQYLSGWFTE